MTANRGSIFVIDDDEDIRETILEIFREEGFEAMGAGDGRSALDLLRAAGAPPAVIFLDLMMPGMNGADFLAEQRADPSLADIPVVLVSADARASEKAASLGVRECLRKPLKLERLIDTAARYAARSA